MIQSRRRRASQFRHGLALLALLAACGGSKSPSAGGMCGPCRQTRPHCDSGLSCFRFSVGFTACARKVGDKCRIGAVISPAVGDGAQQRPSADPIDASGLAIADLDGDGGPDAVMVGTSAGEEGAVLILMSDAIGGGYRPWQRLDVGFRAVSIAVRDGDGDGLGDLLVTGEHGEVTCWSGDGRGSFEPRHR